jgi:O-antigen ligase/tetratricopeptide (TPR) repeat protein
MKPPVDRAVAAGVTAAAIIAPLLLGATHASAYVALEVGIFALVALWMLRLWSARMAPPSLWRGRVGIIAAPLMLLILWTGFQALPLPPALLHRVAPSTYRVYQRVLPGWPASSPEGWWQQASAAATKDSRWVLPTAAEAAGGARVPFATASKMSTSAYALGVGSFWTSLDALRWRNVSLAPAATRHGWLKLCAYAALFLMTALYPFGVDDSARTGSRNFMRLIFGALVGLAILEGLAGIWGSVSGNALVLQLLHPLEWSPMPWGARTTGTFANPDHFAFFLNFALPACLAGVFAPAAFVRRSDGNSCRLLCATAALLALSALLLSGSRGGWASAAITIALLIYMLRRTEPAAPSFRLRWIAGAIAGLLMLASLVYVGSAGRTMMRERIGAVAGEMNWRITPAVDSVPMLARFPWFGVGLGAWPDLFRGYQRPPWSGTFYNAAHNDGLQLLAETGIVGAGLFAMALGAALVAVRRAWSQTAGTERVYLAVAIAPIPGALLHELVDFSLQIPANAIIFSVVLGLAMRIAWTDTAAPAGAFRPSHRIAYGFGVIAALTLALMAACQSRGIPHPLELRASASLDQLHRAFLRHPADSRVHLMIASKMKGSEAEAQELRTALYLEPGNPAAHDGYARVLAAEGQSVAAMHELSESTYYAPAFSAHWYLSERMVGWLSPAERHAVLAGLRRGSAQGFAGAELALGSFYSALGDTRAAATHFAHGAAAEATANERMRCWILAGRAYAASNDFERASAAMQSAIDADERRNEGYQAMISEVLVPAGHIEQARRLVARAIDNGASPALLYLALADAEQRQTGRAGAESDLRKGIDAEPANFDCIERLGSLYLADANYDEAIRWLRAAVVIRPDFPPALLSLAQAQEAAYDYTAADISYARAIALAPDNPGIRETYRAFRRKLTDAARLAPSVDDSIPRHRSY